MRITLVVLLTITAAGVLWLAGEQHRENCLATGKTACSVLPWDSGKAATTSSRPAKIPLDITGCVQLKVRNKMAALDGAPVERMPVECEYLLGD